MCVLWRVTCTGFITPEPPTTGWGWRRSSEWECKHITLTNVHKSTLNPPHPPCVQKSSIIRDINLFLEVVTLGQLKPSIILFYQHTENDECLKLFLHFFWTLWSSACIFSHQKLTNVRIMKENMRTGNLPANMRKNRVLQIIPCKDFSCPSYSSYCSRFCRRALSCF